MFNLLKLCQMLLLCILNHRTLESKQSYEFTWQVMLRLLQGTRLGPKECLNNLEPELPQARYMIFQSDRRT